MVTSDWRLRQAHRLLQLGILLFLFALLVGLAVPSFAVPRLALSVHLLGLMQGLFLAVLGLMVGVTRRELAALVLTAPAPIPSRFLGDTLQRVRSMTTPVLLMVENGDELGGLAAVRDIDVELKRRGKADHRTIRYDRGGGHFLFVKKDYWWDDLRSFLDEKLKRP